MTGTNPRNEYGVDKKTFIYAWETSETVEEVELLLAERSRAAGLQPMPKPIILARASGYRQQGIKLRKFKPGRKTRHVDELNQFIADIRSGKAVELPPAMGRVASPPVINKGLTEKWIQGAVERLQQEKAQVK